MLSSPSIRMWARMCAPAEGTQIAAPSCSAAISWLWRLKLRTGPGWSVGREPQHQGTALALLSGPRSQCAPWGAASFTWGLNEGNAARGAITRAGLANSRPRDFWFSSLRSIFKSAVRASFQSYSLLDNSG